jgi:hypothetical protein
VNQALKKTALFVRDLLAYQENLIRIGRGNHNIEDFETNYIGVDTIGTSIRLATGEKFDDVNEIMTHAQMWQTPIVLSFYGNDADSNASDFSCLIKSQAAFELQQTLGIGLYQASQATDVKTLTGQQYGNRIELNLNVIHTISADVATLYIESVEIELNSEQSTQILPIDEIVSVSLNETTNPQPTPEPPEACDLENFQIFVDGEGQVTALSGTNDSIVTATSNGTTNTFSTMGALNTVFKANANPIVWIGEATVTAQDIPEVTTDSSISLQLVFLDAVTFGEIATVRAAWRLGSETNKLLNSSDAVLSAIDLSNGFKVGMYYDSAEGKVYAALDSETTFELPLDSVINIENNKVLVLNVFAGNIEDTSISVQFNQSGTDTIQAFESVPWCQAVYNEA